jgi:NADH-quinone oxidoreductase subunit H
MDVLFFYVYILVSNIIIFLILTIVIATLTLMERKLLALVQRRVGPNYIGYRGRLQFIADAIKLLTKHILIISGANKILFLIVPVAILILCYLF